VGAHRYELHDRREGALVVGSWHRHARRATDQRAATLRRSAAQDFDSPDEALHAANALYKEKTAKSHGYVHFAGDPPDAGAAPAEQ
jgi:hypothetical protein